MTNPGLLDYIAIAAVIFIEPVISWQWYWPRCVREIRAHIPGARERFYRTTFATLWAFAIYVLGLWVAKGRPWSTLRLGSAIPWRMAGGFLVAAGVIAFLVGQMRKVQKALARPKAVARLREQLAFADPMVPETDRDRRGFWLLSITAGICEEVIFRGFLIWFITAYLGLVAAVILSSILFGWVHMYLGAAQVPRTAIIGFVLALVVIASGSLWPAMIIHAAIDLHSGEIGFRVGRAPAATAEAPAAEVASTVTN